ncbi:MAG TPA: N-acetyltransferase [Streptomyces sp.]|uniref:N-acetyltransferase n=1 Tax=Streptomyces sp. TaxID=1931 RepID=UPI002D415119|nr:N-acetyltransferase [Streptomyces sp.]HZG06070.1 N-acetyltransferase [Streptomyces sp.]
MTGTDSLVLRRTADVAEVRQLLLDVHVEVRGEFGLLEQPFNSVERFDERLGRYASRPGWEAVIGYRQDEPVGYVFGVPLAPDTGWWSTMRQPLPKDYVRETGSRTFAVNEILVRRPWRGTAGAGTSRRLHEALLARRTEERATLLVDPTRSDGRLKAVYESWGYEEVGRQQPFPDSPVFAAMVRDPLHR